MKPMQNKYLGTILIGLSIILIILLIILQQSITKPYNEQINYFVEHTGTCHDNTSSCPHEAKAKAQIPIYLAGAIVLALLIFGLYITFFEKNQQEILQTLQHKKNEETNNEKFEILLKGLNEDEQKVMRAVKEQDGISQSTLRLRTDLHKSKLSIIISDLEKKGLVKKEREGKKNSIHLKIHL